MRKVFGFDKGMSEVINPKFMPDGMCELIQNMYPDKDGTWKAFPALVKDTTLGTFDNGAKEAYSVYGWNVGNLLTGMDDTYGYYIYVVFFTDGTVNLKYWNGSAWAFYDVGEITNINYSALMVWSDAHQFVFTDGRDGSPAKRIRIDEDGVVHAGNLSVASCYSFPTLISFTYDNEDEEGTGIGRGGIFAYRAVFINKFGERSKPTPLLMVDSYQWQQRGVVEADESYIYSDELRGSLKSATVQINDIPDDTEEVELYRADAYGSESLQPMSVMRRVASKIVSDTETNVQFIDSFPYGLMELDVAGAGSPSGDDICVLNGTVFVANAVNTIDFPVDIDNCYLNKLTLTNPNEYNYVNRWIQLDLFDDDINNGTTTQYLKGYDWDDFAADKVRIYADDLITPLKVFHYDTDSTLEDSNGGTVAARKYVFVRVPYMPASSDTVIYFVASDAAFPAGYPNEFVKLSDMATARDSFYGAEVVCNPVRGEETIICISNKLITLNTQLGTNYRKVNKANSNYERSFNSAYTFDDLLINTNPIHLYDEFCRAQDDAITFNDTGYEYSDYNLTNTYELDSIKLRRKGYFYLWVGAKEGAYISPQLANLVKLKEGDNSILQLLFEDNDDGTGKFIFKAYDSEETPSALSITSSDISFGAGAWIECFVLCSWQCTINPTDVNDSEWKLSMAVIQNGHSGTVDVATEVTSSAVNAHINESETLTITTYVQEANLEQSHLCIQFGEYLQQGGTVDIQYHALQLCRFFPLFPTGFVGINYSTQTIGIADYYVNDNVTFDAITTVTDNSPGRIFWSNYGALTGINEQNLHEEIYRIAPMKSLMPTDEHSTILIWTRKDLWRMPLFDDLNNCKPIKDWAGSGLTMAYSLALVPGGIAWHNDDGVLYLTQNGMENITKGRVNYSIGSTEPRIYGDYANNRIWLQGSGTSRQRYYDISNKVLVSAYLPVASGYLYLYGIMGMNGEYWYDYNDNFCYTFTGTTKAATSIYTKGFNTGRNKKLHRFRLLSNLFAGTYTFLVRLMGTWIGRDSYQTMEGKPTPAHWTVDSTGRIYTHVTGNTTTLQPSSHTPEIGKTYTVSYTISAALTSVTFGGNTLTAMGTYPLTVTSTVTATTAAPLTFTPISASTTAVSNIQIYGGNVETSSYTGYYNRMTSVPNAKSEWVQLKLTNPDQVTGIEVEVE